MDLTGSLEPGENVLAACQQAFRCQALLMRYSFHYDVVV